MLRIVNLYLQIVGPVFYCFSHFPAKQDSWGAVLGLHIKRQRIEEPLTLRYRPIAALEKQSARVTKEDSSVQSLFSFFFPPLLITLSIQRGL